MANDRFSAGKPRRGGAADGDRSGTGNNRGAMGRGRGAARGGSARGDRDFGERRGGYNEHGNAGAKRGFGARDGARGERFTERGDRSSNNRERGNRFDGEQRGSGRGARVGGGRFGDADNKRGRDFGDRRRFDSEHRDGSAQGGGAYGRGDDRRRHDGERRFGRDERPQRDGERRFGRDERPQRDGERRFGRDDRRERTGQGRFDGDRRGGYERSEYRNNREGNRRFDGDRRGFSDNRNRDGRGFNGERAGYGENRGGRDGYREQNGRPNRFNNDKPRRFNDDRPGRFGDDKRRFGDDRPQRNGANRFARDGQTNKRFGGDRENGFAGRDGRKFNNRDDNRRFEDKPRYEKRGRFEGDNIPETAEKTGVSDEKLDTSSGNTAHVNDVAAQGMDSRNAESRDNNPSSDATAKNTEKQGESAETTANDANGEFTRSGRDAHWPEKRRGPVRKHAARAGKGREKTKEQLLQEQFRPVRAEHKDPEIPEEVRLEDLANVVRNQLKTLEKRHAEQVGKHLAAVSYYLESDPETAHQHALSASRKAGRISVTREYLAMTAYHTGDYALALRELRTYRRISGRNDHIALMIDSERGVGRPEKAVETGKEVDFATLTAEQRVYAAIALSGAYLDLGQTAQALKELEIPELNPSKAYIWSPDLFRAYAAVLEDLGRVDDAKLWERNANAAQTALNDAYGTDEELEIFELEEIPDEGSYSDSDFDANGDSSGLENDQHQAESDNAHDLPEEQDSLADKREESDTNADVETDVAAENQAEGEIGQEEPVQDKSAQNAKR